MIPLPDPPLPALVIPLMIAADVLVIWVMHRLISRPLKRHRFKGPAKPRRQWRRNRIVRRENDLW
jgi:hypothetical protein